MLGSPVAEKKGKDQKIKLGGDVSNRQKKAKAANAFFLLPLQASRDLRGTVEESGTVKTQKKGYTNGVEPYYRCIVQTVLAVTETLIH